MGDADLIRSAMLLMDWCSDQVLEGRAIASIAEDGSVREFSMPALEAARAHLRITLSEEALNVVLQDLAKPAEPTDALRELLASNLDGG